MKPVAYDYAAPRVMHEAVDLLAQGEGTAKVMAGGQSLGPMLNLRLAQPALLVDVRHVEGMTRIEKTDAGVELGACVTHARIEDGEVPGTTGEFMRQVAADIAYRAVRNRGTVGGSLCHADPAADWMSAMLLLDATLVVVGDRGERAVPIDAFMASAFSTALAEHEVLRAVRVPRLPPSARWSYRKFCRKPGEFAEALACVLVDAGRGCCRAVIGATAGRPVLLRDASALLATRDPDAVRAAVEAATGGDDPCADDMQCAMLRRALQAVAA